MLFILAISILLACSKEEVANIPPRISFPLFMPGITNLGTYVNDTLAFLIDAHDEDGSIEKVSFYIDSLLIGEAFSEPYTFMHIFTKIGRHTIKFIATDNQATKSNRLMLDTYVYHMPGIHFEYWFQYFYDDPNKTLEVMANVWKTGLRFDHISLLIDDSLVQQAQGSVVYHTSNVERNNGHHFKIIATDEFGRVFESDPKAFKAGKYN